MRLWVNKARTVLVSEMEDGNLTVALRDSTDGIWGPPILCVTDHEGLRSPAATYEARVAVEFDRLQRERHRESRA
jgi:hypothetical protein